MFGTCIFAGFEVAMPQSYLFLVFNSLSDFIGFFFVELRYVYVGGVLITPPTILLLSGRVCHNSPDFVCLRYSSVIGLSLAQLP